MGHRLGRRAALRLAVLAAAVSGASNARPAFAESDAWPARPVRIVVASGAGGSNDLIARWLAERLTRRFGQPLVVDNRPGGGGVVAIENVLQQPADGYTVFYANASTFSMMPALDPRLRYDPLRDFVPVAQIGTAPHCLLVRGGLQARSLEEFIAHAKANPGRLNVATSGTGGAPQMYFELLAKATGIEAVQVPFRTSAQGMQELAAGRVDAFIIDLAPAEPFLDTGQVRCLAVNGTARWPERPDVPNFADSGLPLTTVGRSGLFLRAGTPPAVAERFSSEVRDILHSPGVREQFL